MKKLFDRREKKDRDSKVAEISGPFNFSQQLHVEHDRSTGEYRNLPPAWQRWLETQFTAQERKDNADAVMKALDFMAKMDKDSDKQKFLYHALGDHSLCAHDGAHKENCSHAQRLYPDLSGVSGTNTPTKPTATTTTTVATTPSKRGPEPVASPNATAGAKTPATTGYIPKLYPSPHISPSLPSPPAPFLTPTVPTPVPSAPAAQPATQRFAPPVSLGLFQFSSVH